MTEAEGAGMNMSRGLGNRRKGRRAGAVCVMAGALLVCEPFVAGAFAATQPGNTGAASITINLPALTVTDPVGGSRALSLGSVSLAAQSYPTLGASLYVGNLSAMGQVVPGHSVSASQGTKSGDLNVPVSAGPVTGSIGVAGYQLQAGNGAASVSAHALNAQLAVAPLGL